MKCPQLVLHEGRFHEIPEGGDLPQGCLPPIAIAYCAPSTGAEVWQGTNIDRKGGVELPIELGSRQDAEDWLIARKRSSPS